ncbi:non-classical arabinogalactan protein 30 [Lactuca sativa]|uniref:non-classical arabinogalactan protein 30 n=1 Tax=Lactuca sativa TaxID=4236 RepID=UPI000CB7DAD6|nr:non-classical arabinogalactan protein 30 [Lactuca sativa]
MANNQMIITILILLQLAFLKANTTTHEVATRYRDDPRDDYPPRDDINTARVVVEGKVYCERCKYGGPWSLSGAQPIEAARVSVICKNYKRRLSYYKTYSTDHDGYFYAELKGFRMSHYLLDHPLQSCRVKLVSSPLDHCNLISNVNNGVGGSPLRFENKVLFRRNTETVIYAAGPLAFRPNDCYAQTTP